MIAAPLQVGTLYAPMPWTFVCHIFAYLFGEMWLGVAAAVVIDLVPTDITASAIAVYFFIIQIIGGNMNLLVTPIRESLDMRTALLITFPGLYLIGALFFLFALLVLLKRKVHSYDISSKVHSYDISSGDSSKDSEYCEIDDAKVTESAEKDATKETAPNSMEPYTYIPSTEKLYQNSTA